MSNSRRRENSKRFSTPLTLVLAFVAGIGVALYMFSKLNHYVSSVGKQFNVGEKISSPASLSTEIFAIDGAKIGEISEERRYFVSLESLSPYVPKAFVAAEDQSFYDHMGVSPTGIMRSMVANIKAGRIVQGASTITQQLARLYFLNQEQSFLRKFKEAALAISLETKLSKDRILELYLNKIFLGNHSYGVEAAARNYFRKSANELNVGEAAMLAGIAAAPSKYAPHRFFRRAKKRQAYVIKRMYREGYLAADEAKRWLKHEIRIADAALKENEFAPHFVEEIKKESSHYFDMEKIPEAGLKIFSTLNLQMQLAAQRVAAKARRDFLRQIPSAKMRDFEMSFMAVDAKSGAILTMIGSVDFDETQFNFATQGRRPLGSLFMPFYYGLAFDRGYELYHSLFQDGVEVRCDESGCGGHVSILEGLTQAKAEESARLFSWLGVGTVSEFAKSLGFEITKPNLAMALGIEKSSLKIAMEALSIVENQGRIRRLHLINKVLDKDHSLVRATESGQSSRQLLTAEASYLLKFALQRHVDDGAAKPACIAERSVWGMLGTDASLHDGWFVGGVEGIMFGLWIGSRQGRHRLAHSQAQLQNQVARLWRTQVEPLLPYINGTNSDEEAPSGIGFVSFGPQNDKLTRGFLPVKLSRSVKKFDIPL